MTTDLSPSDELNLYKTDRRAWAIATAPRRAAQLAAITDPDAKQRLWEQFGDESRQALRDLAARQAHERATAGNPTATPAHHARPDQSGGSDSDA